MHKTNTEMFKDLKDFINDIKERDEDDPSLEGINDKEIFPEDFGCPSQSNDEEDKPNLFDELGGIPAPEPNDWDEDRKEEEECSFNKRRKNILERFFQTQGLLPDDDDYI